MLVDIGGVKMNDSAKIIKEFAGRKGGRRRVKKGFAKTLTSEKAREYANKRWAYKRSQEAAVEAVQEQVRVHDSEPHPQQET